MKDSDCSRSYLQPEADYTWRRRPAFRLRGRRRGATAAVELSPVARPSIRELTRGHLGSSERLRRPRPPMPSSRTACDRHLASVPLGGDPSSLDNGARPRQRPGEGHCGSSRNPSSLPRTHHDSPSRHGQDIPRSTKRLVELERVVTRVGRRR